MDEEKNPQLKMENKQNQGELTTKRKLAFLGLVIFSVMIIYLGFKQMSNNLKTPFALFAIKYSGEDVAVKTETQQMLELKNKDTDKDGLTDYDELYIFNTSPYLPDSDSDGTGDKEEVDGGTDPNCPKGQDCFASEIANAVSGKVVTSTVGDPSSSIPSAEQMLLQNIFTTNPNAKQLRDFLVQSGGDKNLLDKISDEELVTLFKDFMTSSTSTLNTGTTTDLQKFGNLIGATTNQATGEAGKVDLNALRQSLKDKGVPEETLKQLDDKTLLDLINQL